MGRCVAAVLRVLGGRALLSDAVGSPERKVTPLFRRGSKTGVTMRAFLAQLRSLRFNANQSRGFTALRLDCGIATNGWWEEAAATSSSRHAVSGASARPLPPSHVTDDRSRRLQHPRTTPPRHPLPRVHADRRALARPLGVPDHRLSRECVSRRGIPPEPPSLRGAVPVVVVRVHRRGRTIHRPPPLDDHSAGGHRRRRRLRGDRHRR